MPTYKEFDTRYVETNGIRLHVVEAGPEDGPLVILLHGFPEFWYGWRKQIEPLAEAGFRIWVPDQRGYNLSDKPQGIRAYRIDETMNDVLGLIDAAGREKAMLVGHDWGGGAAWWSAMHHPERIEKLVILNMAHPKVFVDTLRSTPEQWFRSTYAAFFQIPLLPETLLLAGDCAPLKRGLRSTSRPGAFSDAALEEYARAWKQPGALTAMLNWYRANAQHPPQMPADTQVHVPTLILWGANDVALKREMAQASVDRCENGHLVMFEDATHWVQHEEAARVNEWIVGFLQGQG
jgi:epoxide hydrolase 4